MRWMPEGCLKPIAPTALCTSPSSPKLDQVAVDVSGAATGGAKGWSEMPMRRLLCIARLCCCAAAVCRAVGAAVVALAAASRVRLRVLGTARLDCRARHTVARPRIKLEQQQAMLTRHFMYDTALFRLAVRGCPALGDNLDGRIPCKSCSLFH